MNPLELLCSQLIADKKILRKENADLRKQLEDAKIEKRIILAKNEITTDGQLKDYMKSKL